MHLNDVFLIDWKIIADWSTFARSYDSRYDICDWNSNWCGLYHRRARIANTNMHKGAKELIYYIMHRNINV